MEVIPVLDLLDGVVVHAVGGRRNEYRPVRSLLTQSPEPQAVLDALIDRFGFSVFYVAEINGLMNGRPDFESLANLMRSDVKFIVDAGAATADQAKAIADLGADWIVAASETLRSQRELEKMIEAIGAERLVFSLDMRNGVPIVADGLIESHISNAINQSAPNSSPLVGEEARSPKATCRRGVRRRINKPRNPPPPRPPAAAFGTSPTRGEDLSAPRDLVRDEECYLLNEDNPQLIVESVAELGVTRFILLDLADVGEGRGMSTLPLLRGLRSRLEKCWFAVGGGIRDQADLDAAEQAGADAVLMASAIHNGQFPFTNERRS